MSNSAMRRCEVELPAATAVAAPDRQLAGRSLTEAGVVLETAVVVNQMDKLIAGRVQDMALLRSIAESLKQGASAADIHRKLLVLARSSREAFQSLQSSRDALISLHRASSGGAIMPVVDELTGFPNLAGFEVKLEETLEKSAAARDTVLMFIEIGALQLLINEAGTKMANRVVKRFATILRRSVKHSDFIARTSPQRFALIFQNVLPDNVAPIALRIHEAMQSRLSPSKDPVMQLLSVAIGIAGNLAQDESSTALLKRAEESLVLARKQVGAGIYIV